MAQGSVLRLERLGRPLARGEGGRAAAGDAAGPLGDIMNSLTLNPKLERCPSLKR